MYDSGRQRRLHLGAGPGDRHVEPHEHPSRRPEQHPRRHPVGRHQAVRRVAHLPRERRVRARRACSATATTRRPTRTRSTPASRRRSTRSGARRWSSPRTPPASCGRRGSRAASIWLNRTTGGDNAWGTPFTHARRGNRSTPTTSRRSSRSAATRSASSGATRARRPDADFFAIHNDADGDTTWTIETAYSGTNVADDHVNLKTDSSGRVYRGRQDQPAGCEPAHRAARPRSERGVDEPPRLARDARRDAGHPRLDEVNGLLRVFVTSAGQRRDHQPADRRRSGRSHSPGGEGTEVLKDASALKMNNATGTKQNVTADSGLIVVGYNDTTRRYWHADILGGGPPPNTAPTANATSATTTTDVAVGVALSGSDPETCELSFSIVTGPAHGSLGSIGGRPARAAARTPTARRSTYTPTTGYSGPDSFTYKVNDGTPDSSPATASLTVNGGPDITAPPRGATSSTGRPFDRLRRAAGRELGARRHRPTPRGQRQPAQVTQRGRGGLGGDPHPGQPGHLDRQRHAVLHARRQPRSRTSPATSPRTSATRPCQHHRRRPAVAAR